jgi:putative Mg2+ transporter-C (MgtC) family protein
MWISLWDELRTDLRSEILIRVGLATLAGFILGYERERHGRAAGLRTTLLVSLASCVAMIISDSFYLNHLRDTKGALTWHPDPARLAAGALSGMGFLGAGVIIKQSSTLVLGVTTAATLWLATVVGLSFGAGALGIGLLGTAMSIVVLYIMPALEGLIDNDWYSDLSLKVDPAAGETQKFIATIEGFGIKIKGVDLEEDVVAPERRITFHIKYKKSGVMRHAIDVTAALRTMPGVRAVHWRG